MTAPSEDESSPAPKRIVWLVAAAAVVLVVGLGAAFVLRDDGSGAPAPSTSTSSGGGGAAGTAGRLGDGWGPEEGGRTPLGGFDETTATITGPGGDTCDVCLLLASTPDQRQRGLMEVTDPDLGGYDGMLFQFDSPITGGFWMRNTPMPLSIAYYRSERSFLEAQDMEPCEDDPACPSYPVVANVQYAVEVAQGGLEEILAVPGSSIRIDGEPCPPRSDTGDDDGRAQG